MWYIFISAVFFIIFAFLFKKLKHSKIMFFPFCIYLVTLSIWFIYDAFDFSNNFNQNIWETVSYILILIIWILALFLFNNIKYKKKYVNIKYYSSSLILFSILVYATCIFEWLPVLHDMDSFFFRSSYSDGGEILIWIALFILLSFFYLITYWFYNYFNKKNELTLRKKSYFILRNCIIIFIAFITYFSVIDISIIYSKYYDWYKDPAHFSGQIYTCIDKDTKLILEKKYKHHPIVNPYDNFIEFYKNYWVGSPYYPTILTNMLSSELINWDYLKSCINSRWENYYDNYFIAHWEKPKYLYDNNHSQRSNYLPSHSTEEIKKINKLLKK